MAASTRQSVVGMVAIVLVDRRYGGGCSRREGQQKGPCFGSNRTAALARRWRATAAAPQNRRLERAAPIWGGQTASSVSSLLACLALRSHTHARELPRCSPVAFGFRLRAPAHHVSSLLSLAWILAAAPPPSCPEFRPAARRYVYGVEVTFSLPRLVW